MMKPREKRDVPKEFTARALEGSVHERDTATLATAICCKAAMGCQKHVHLFGFPHKHLGTQMGVTIFTHSPANTGIL